MSVSQSNGSNTSRRTLPPWPQLWALAVLLPAVVTSTNQLVMSVGVSHAWLRVVAYPWMAASIALLSWCVGRYLRPAWFCWIVFAWALALLDIQTISACMNHLVADDVGYALVSSQIGLIVLWAVLGPAGWQWRLPVVLVCAALVIVYSGSFTRWNESQWSVLMALTTVAIVIECALLRWAGWRLQLDSMSAKADGETERPKLRLSQFGMIHLFIWATAIVPLLVIGRGLNFLVFSSLDAHSALPALMFVVATAIINLAAIWAVLGPGRWYVRLVLLVAITLPIAHGCQMLINYLVPEQFYNRTPYRFFQTFRWVDWQTWFAMSAVLASALLFFLRGRGHRLVRQTNASSN